MALGPPWSLFSHRFPGPVNPLCCFPKCVPARVWVHLLPLTSTHHTSMGTQELGRGLGRGEERRVAAGFPGQAGWPPSLSPMRPGAASRSLLSHPDRESWQCGWTAGPVPRSGPS